jgi:putative hydrolase of the HAD superfamily
VQNKIEALIFDFGNVITLPQDSDSVNEMAGLLGISVDSLKKSYGRFRHDFDKGEISAAAYWNLILQDNKKTINNDKINRLIELDIKSWTFINDDIIKFLEQIKRIYKLAILSNMPREILAYIKNNLSWMNIFDVSVYSCDYKICKPDKRIFELCIKELNIVPQKCLFIDDLPDNIYGAASAGLNTLLYTNFDLFKEQVKKFIC